MSRKIILAMTVVLVGTMSCRRPPRELDHEEVFTARGLLTADAAGLASTDVSAHLEHPIDPKGGRNVLWCATMQLVWNEFSRRYGGELAGDAEPSVAILNRRGVKRDVIDDESCLLISGWVKDGILGKIPEALKEKFGGLARPRLIPKPEDCRPQDAVAYAYLFKNLEFAVPFESIRQPLEFLRGEMAFDETPVGNDPERLKALDELPRVKCFGIRRDAVAPAAMVEQVLILEYRARTRHAPWPEECIVELKTKSEGDRLILAKVKPAATIGATVAKVEERIRGAKPVTMGPGDTLMVPKLNFDVTRDYRELREGVHSVRRPGGRVEELVLRVAIQNVRFQLDERGARLRSEAVMVGGCCPVSVPGHNLVFNRPFLIMLKRAGADAPYFALWVDNAELLVHSGRSGAPRRGGGR